MNPMKNSAQKKHHTYVVNGNLNIYAHNKKGGGQRGDGRLTSGYDK